MELAGLLSSRAIAAAFGSAMAPGKAAATSPINLEAQIEDAASRGARRKGCPTTHPFSNLLGSMTYHPTLLLRHRSRGKQAKLRGLHHLLNQLDACQGFCLSLENLLHSQNRAANLAII